MTKDQIIYESSNVVIFSCKKKDKKHDVTISIFVKDGKKLRCVNQTFVGVLTNSDIAKNIHEYYKK